MPRYTDWYTPPIIPVRYTFDYALLQAFSYPPYTADWPGLVEDGRGWFTFATAPEAFGRDTGPTANTARVDHQRSAGGASSFLVNNMPLGLVNIREPFFIPDYNPPYSEWPDDAIRVDYEPLDGTYQGPLTVGVGYDAHQVNTPPGHQVGISVAIVNPDHWFYDPSIGMGFTEPPTVEHLSSWTVLHERTWEPWTQGAQGPVQNPLPVAQATAALPGPPSRLAITALPHYLRTGEPPPAPAAAGTASWYGRLSGLALTRAYQRRRYRFELPDLEPTGGPPPLRLRQRGDGLGMSAPRVKSPGSRQASPRVRGYL